LRVGVTHLVGVVQQRKKGTIDVRNKKLLITGGTGSFGNAVLRRFLDSDIAEIRIFSRDEKKQDDMRQALTVTPSSSFTLVMCATCAAWPRPCAGWTMCFTPCAQASAFL
jgi:shikimate 5-dehydrogenase